MKYTRSAVLIGIAALFTLVFIHPATQPASAALPSPAGSLVTSAPEPQQYPVMEKIAAKIIQKHQGSTCEQLWLEKTQAKDKPKSTKEQEAIARSNGIFRRGMPEVLREPWKGERRLQMDRPVRWTNRFTA